MASDGTVDAVTLTARRVRLEVARRGISQRDVAEIIGKSQAAAWRRLAGLTPFTLAELGRLALAFGTSPDQLVGGRS